MNNKGFTIIELLLVISVMAMLTVFMMPNIKHVREKTREMAQRTVMTKIQALLESYYYDNGHYVDAQKDAGEIFEVFKTAGYIGKIPKNPFTGKEYGAGDSEGKIVYVPNNGNYTITGYKNDGTSVMATIESE